MADRQTLVIGAAIVREGRVLVARRSSPPGSRGRWEFPGGKVEPGESPEEAVRREIREELGCEVRVSRWLAGEQPIGEGLRLRVVTADLVSGEPVPREHDAVRWLSPDTLGRLDWLPPDVPFVTEVAKLLTGAVPR